MKNEYGGPERSLSEGRVEEETFVRILLAAFICGF